MKPKRTNHVAQMRAEYDFDYSKAVRGKYYKRLLKEGSNVVVLDRDVAKAFPDSASVNKALRSVLKGKRPRRLTSALCRVEEGAGAPPADVGHQRAVRAHRWHCEWFPASRLSWGVHQATDQL